MKERASDSHGLYLVLCRSDDLYSCILHNQFSPDQEISSRASPPLEISNRGPFQLNEQISFAQ
jgi:hypothetical protein